MTIVNKAELSEFLGVSERTLTEWQKDGLPMESEGERGQSNAYDTQRVIAWWIAREVTKVRSESPRDRLYRAQEELARLTIAEKNRTLVNLDEVEREFSRMIVVVRGRLLQIPNQLGVDDQLRSAVRVEIEGALTELAAYEPNDEDDEN